MKTFRIFLAALLLSAASLAGASVPVIKLVDSQDIAEQLGAVSTVVDHKVGEGSFAFYANDGLPALTSTVSAEAPLVETDQRNAESRGAMFISSHPAMKRWAVLLLVLGCLLYQGRQGRRRPLAFGDRKPA